MSKLIAVYDTVTAIKLAKIIIIIVLERFICLLVNTDKHKLQVIPADVVGCNLVAGNGQFNGHSVSVALFDTDLHALVCETGGLGTLVADFHILLFANADNVARGKAIDGDGILHGNRAVERRHGC